MSSLLLKWSSYSLSSQRCSIVDILYYFGNKRTCVFGSSLRLCVYIDYLKYHVGFPVCRTSTLQLCLQENGVRLGHASRLSWIVYNDILYTSLYKHNQSCASARGS